MSTRAILLAVTLFSVTDGLAPAADLASETLASWNGYVQSVDSKLQSVTQGNGSFLWADEEAGRAERLRAGSVLVAPAAANGIVHIDHGMIHDWVGSIFIPSATAADVIDVIADYGRYKDIYKPVVADSKTTACRGSATQFSMVWTRKVLFVNAAVEGQYEAMDHLLSDSRGYSVSNSTAVREIQSYGKPSESILPDGHGNGFIWRLHTITRYEERDGGVYFEMEAVVLSREAPVVMRHVILPLANRLSSESLETLLIQTRDAVQNNRHRNASLASCGGGSRISHDRQVGGTE